MTKCNYTDDFIGLSSCNEPALSGYDKCILHIPFPNDKDSFLEILNLKYDKINDKIINNDFDFTGAIMGGLNVNGIKINSNVIFDFAEIHGDLDFREDIIKGRVSFNSVNVDGNVYFQNSKIHDELNFMLGTVTTGTVWFDNAVIDGKVYFTGADLEGYLEFNNSVIHNKADFNFKRVGQDARFNKITIEGAVDFNDINVGGYISLEFAEIKGSINFINALIGTSDNTPDGNDSSFTGTNIKGEADFTGTEFFGEAHFLKTSFKENAYFLSTKFNKKADFEEARFYENADFSRTNFKKESNFNKSTFLGTGIFGLKYENRFYSSFENARLKNVAFKNCDLSRVRFKNVIFENCELSTSEWFDNIPEHQNYLNKKINNQNLINMPQIMFNLSQKLGVLWSPKLVPDAKMAADTYRRIRQSLQQQGAYDKAGNFYVEEMNMKREVYWEENKRSWLLYNILWLTTGYGEKLIRIFTIFAFCWIVYIIAVYYMPNNKLVIPVGSGFLSIITALFVYVFARKMAR